MVSAMCSMHTETGGLQWAASELVPEPESAVEES